MSACLTASAADSCLDIRQAELPLSSPMLPSSPSSTQSAASCLVPVDSSSPETGPFKIKRTHRKGSRSSTHRGRPRDHRGHRSMPKDFTRTVNTGGVMSSSSVSSSVSTPTLSPGRLNYIHCRACGEWKPRQAFSRRQREKASTSIRPIPFFFISRSSVF